ncbi:tyrosine-type recombinase/integrase [Methylocystis sp. ATCC 49242]|uniref:tyrosine-type recombinase/integrase n=1 Tax=Methylocystis sp. ATCC 49242 TaxID=622637 RepID=UPI00118508D8|nr:tyrosine-type recombinase/integrase [Methylocystis sp. ATCC 49242]
MTSSSAYQDRYTFAPPSKQPPKPVQWYTLPPLFIHQIDAYRMIQRRAADLGARGRIGCHTFRATGITAYLEAGGTLENAQAMAAHESPRTTKLYDRTGDEITLDEVERITI